MKKSENSTVSFKKQLINIGIVILLTVVIFAIIFGKNKNFSFDEFFEFLGNLNPFYLAGAFVCMLLFIVFEALSLRIILKHMGFKTKKRYALLYSSSDIYYSAITPSATGGQPASVYFMRKSGIYGSAGTAAVTFNIFMYISSIIVIALFAFIASPSSFLDFNWIYQVLIVFGVLIQAVFMLFCFLLMKKPNILKTIAKVVFTFLNKIRIVKDIDARLKSLDKTMAEYKNKIDMILSNRSVALKSFLLNLLQRVSQMSIAVFVYLAAGLQDISIFHIFVLQSYCLLGANAVPIPGAAGVSEGLYLSAFGSLFASKQMLLNCMMATRGIAYYICFIVAGSYTFICHIIMTLKSKKGE